MYPYYFISMEGREFQNNERDREREGQTIFSK